MWYSLSVEFKLILLRQPTRDYVGGIFFAGGPLSFCVISLPSEKGFRALTFLLFP
jgi:hypothetical protein